MGKKILVIDDEGLVTKTLKRLLSKEGYEAVIAESGREALAKLENEDFDLIVSDLRMPDMDGIETIESLRRLRKEQGKPYIPEIVITGYAEENAYNHALELKVADYIFKPFDTQQFLDTIKRNLGSK